jgi:hypothetical protein
MTAIANVALSNTFDYWRIRTNEAINFINNEAANTGSLANINLAIADRVQVANNNAQLANTNLAIADRVQVANNNAQLANTNLAIANRVQVANNNAQLANTNLAIADRVQVANLNSTLSGYTSNTYASNTFSSYDTIIITTPTAATEYDFLRKLPRNKDYRTIYYSTQFGSANVGFWIGSTLVANVAISATANTNSVSVTGKTGDRVYIHLYDTAISTTANLEFSFGG